MKRLLSLLILMVLTVAWVTSSFGITARQTRLYGTIYSITGDSLGSAKVTITLAGRNSFYTTTATVAAGEIVAYTDTAIATRGRFSVLLWGTDSLLPAGYATYSIKIEHPEFQKSGTSFNPTGLSIAADGDSTNLRDVLAQ